VIFVLSAFLLFLSQNEVSPEALEWFRKGENLIGTEKAFGQEQAQYFEKALALQPDFSAACFNLMVIYQKQGRMEKALEVTNRYVDLNPEDYRGFHFRGLLQQQRNAPEEALADFERASGLAPENHEVWQSLAELYYELRRYEGAAEAFEKVLRYNPAPVQAYFGLALARQRLGQIEQAVESYRKYLAVYPDDAQARFFLALAYRDQNRLQEALDQLKRAAAIDPKNQEIVRLMGEVSLALGDLEEARASIGAGGRDDARSLGNLGILAKQQGQLEMARDYLTRALEKEPENALLWGHLGDVWADLEDPERTREAYLNAVRWNPADFDSLLNLGTLLANRGLEDEGLTYLERAVELDPDSGPAHFHLALVLDRLNRDEGAQQHYRKALSAGLEDARAHYRLAVLYSRQARLEPALEHLRSAFELEPEKYVPLVVGLLNAVKSELDGIRYSSRFAELLQEYREYWTAGH
jgi:tetratricopeptide (TPR) repeat protein